MTITRRTLLTWGLGGTALLTVGGVGLGLRPGGGAPAPAGLKVLDDRSYGVLAAIADRTCPGGNGWPTAAELGVAVKVDTLLSTMDPGKASEVVSLLKVFDNALAGLLLDGRATPFSATDPATQHAVLEAWRTSDWWVRRLAYKALRGLVASAYYASPEVEALCGYPGPPDFSAFRASIGASDPSAPPTGSELPPAMPADTGSVTEASP